MQCQRSDPLAPADADAALARESSRRLATHELGPRSRVPGFTRGIDFFDRLAFVGLSQVRESAVFSGIPITERVEERSCGVWVIDTMTGAVIAFLKFEDQVQEIFSVAVLPGIRYPDLINDDDQIIGSSYVLPDAALKDVSQSSAA